MGPNKFLIGLPEILTKAHVSLLLECCTWQLLLKDSNVVLVWVVYSSSNQKTLTTLNTNYI